MALDILFTVHSMFWNRECGQRALAIAGLDPERLVRPWVQRVAGGVPGLDEGLASLAGYGIVWDALARQIKAANTPYWDAIVLVMRRDNVLMEAGTSRPPSGEAALMFLHKLTDAHAAIFADTATLTGADRDELARRQEEYSPVLEQLKERFDADRLYRDAVRAAVDFLEKLMAYPSLKNPQQDASALQFQRKRTRTEDTETQTPGEPSGSTGASYGATAAFVSLLKFV
jgi:hypothetical protein